MTRKPFLPAEPAVGARLLIIAQEFTAVRKQHFTRRDGSPGVMITWRSECAECGKPFTARSMVEGGSPSRRCREHLKPGRAVGKQRRPLNIVVIQPEPQP